MWTIRRSGELEREWKRSRFVCALARLTAEDEAREFIAQRRKRHHEARHHCVAYVLGDHAENQKSNDDGEPAGTAGVPMLEALRRDEITNVVAVVSRYFGGVKLGAGGLVRAYRGVVADALGHVGRVQRRLVRVLSTRVEYALAGRLENDLRSAGYRIVDIHYSDHVRFDVSVPETEVGRFRAWLAEATAGFADVVLGPASYADAGDD